MKLEHVNLLLAVAVAATALWQYWRAQKWKRAEFVASEIKAAFSDPAVRNALYMLDWNAKIYDLRERDDQSHLVHVEISDDDLVKALMPHSKRPEGFTLVEERIRVVFDEFLGCLQRFEHFIETGLVTKDDVFPYLRYWIDILGRPAPEHKSTATLNAIWRYIDFYGYSAVQQFMRRFKYDITVLGNDSEEQIVVTPNRRVSM